MFHNGRRDPFKIGFIYMFILALSLFQGCSGNNDDNKPDYLVLIELTSSDCKGCQEIHRIVQDLKEHYKKDKLSFVTLDLSSSTNRVHAVDTAKQFNSEAFVKRYQDRPGTVGLINALNGKRLGMLQNNIDESSYVAMIDKVFAELSKQ